MVPVLYTAECVSSHILQHGGYKQTLIFQHSTLHYNLQCNSWNNKLSSSSGSGCENLLQIHHICYDMYMMPRVMDTALFQQNHQFQGGWELLCSIHKNSVCVCARARVHRDVQCSVYTKCTQTVNDTVNSEGSYHAICYKDLMTLRRTLHEVMQNWEREDICKDLISPAHDNPTLLSNITTGHTTWFFLYYPHIKPGQTG